MKLSIVTTLYKSSDYIEEFYIRISKETKKITENYEIIFVDDGSPDDSLQKALALFEKDDRIIVLELSRNFGHHKAIITGLNHANGDYVFIIDSDLEEEPELLGKFWHELDSDKSYDYVYGVQQNRKGKWFQRVTGWLYYKVINLLSEAKVASNQVTSTLMKKNYVKNLLRFKDKRFLLFLLYHLNGFKKKEIFVLKKNSSSTTYSFRLKFHMAVSSIVSYSPKLLYFIFYCGILITTSSFFFILYLMLIKLFLDPGIDGWVSIMVAVFLFGGLNILFIGILGIFLFELYYEVKDRPLTVIKKVYYNQTRNQ
jgi:putative glycosyltransferase